MTKALPRPRPLAPASEAAALTFAQAHHRWLQISHDPQSWTEPDRQRSLAAAFLQFHAAKLALAEATDVHGASRPSA